MSSLCVDFIKKSKSLIHVLLFRNGCLAPEEPVKHPVNLCIFIHKADDAFHKSAQHCRPTPRLCWPLWKVITYEPTEENETRKRSKLLYRTQNQSRFCFLCKHTRHVHSLLSRRLSLSSSALPRYSSAIADWASRNGLPQPH